MPSGVLSNCTSSTHAANVRVENSIIKRKMENGKRKSASKREQKHGRDAACSVRERQTKRTLHAASLHPRAGADSRRRSGLKRKTSRTENGKRKTESGKVIKRDTESMREHGRDTACRVRKQKRSRRAVSPTSLWELPTSTPFDWVLKNIFLIFPISAFILRCLLLFSDTAFAFRSLPLPSGRVGVGLFHIPF